MMRLNQVLHRQDLVGIITVFSYIFSFYVVGPITSSIVVGLPYLYLFIRNRQIFKLDKFTIGVVYFLILILFLCLFYSIVHVTFDFSYLKTMIGQLIHLSVGVSIVVIFRKKYHCKSEDIEKYIIGAFLAQSIIELIASVTPPFASSLLYFNRAYEFAVDEPGRRGLALASGTGWSLGLAFGLLYIIYVKRYLLAGVSALKIGVGVILLAGTIFAGRTGFVGALYGMLLFMLNSNRSLIYKIGIVFKILIFIILICFLFYIFLPRLTEHLIENVFPFAFEPFYRLFYNNEFSTGSTDRLQEMWEVTITPVEALFGTGNFTESSGRYYKHIDIGIMRNLFYWGIGGYSIMILYQMYFLSPIKSVSFDWRYKWNMLMYRFCLTAYLFTMEFKAMTIGYNKMSMSIVFLLGFFYYHESKKQRRNISISNNTML